MGNLVPNQGRYDRGPGPFGPQQGPFVGPQQGNYGRQQQSPFFGPQQDRYGGQQQGPLFGPQQDRYGGQQQGPFVGPQQNPVQQQAYNNNPGFQAGTPPVTALQPAYGQPPHGFEQQSYPPYPQQGYPYQGYPSQGYPHQGYQQGSSFGSATGCAACMACLTCLLCSCCQGMMGPGMHGLMDSDPGHGTTPVTPPQTEPIDADANVDF